MPLTELTDAQPAAIRRWLSIVGIGEDGIDGLSPVSRDLIQSATLVFGGTRHLALATPLIRGTSRPWTSPFDRSVAEVLANRGRDVCVLASGNPFLYGVGSLLAPHVSRAEILTVPAPSAFSLAAARLLWPLPQTILLSLCGRSTDLIRPHLHPGTRILTLTTDAQTPAAVADLLCRIGFGRSRLTVLESLAGPRERIRTARADSFALDAIDPLNTVGIEVEADVGARILPRTAGLDDEWFEHDGQLTKREIRALTLSALAPRRGEHLWDIGAGSGSVAIEWLLADPSLTASALERRADRAERVRRNAGTFGVPHLQLIEGAAPEALAGLRTPDAVFIGGGASQSGVIDAARSFLRSSGRLVVNAVSLQTEAVLLDYQSRWGGSLTRISIARASPIGATQTHMSGWRPHMPIMQWTWVKP